MILTTCGGGRSWLFKSRICRMSASCASVVACLVASTSSRRMFLRDSWLLAEGGTESPRSTISSSLLKLSSSASLSTCAASLMPSAIDSSALPTLGCSSTSPKARPTCLPQLTHAHALALITPKHLPLYITGSTMECRVRTASPLSMALSCRAAKGTGSCTRRPHGAARSSVLASTSSPFIIPSDCFPSIASRATSSLKNPSGLGSGSSSSIVGGGATSTPPAAASSGWKSSATSSASGPITARVTVTP
mmetsp:Transcript_4433/g.8225  ORF Transcript_4433/g.8225 Transcript_4433/m.8225 type:complete len:249 (+) Transcript_4433:568-1314(+)